MSIPSDHPRLGPGQDPYPSVRQFQAFPVSEVGRGQSAQGESRNKKRKPGDREGAWGWPCPNWPTHVFTLRPCGTPIPGQICARPQGEATRPAWAGAGCLRTGTGAAWIGFPEAIYIYKKAAESPWAGRSLRVQHCGPPRERSEFLSRGWLSIYSLSQAGQGS